MADFFTLGIETSCDETAVAVVANGTRILSNVISSQVATHAKFGGVVPEMAAREHGEAILPVYQMALAEANVKLKDIGLVAATYGPGLIGCLLVGLSFAKGLALATGLPFVGVNHIEGHIYANILERTEVKLPLVCLTVSGGHTDLLYLEKWGSYRILGRTRDDAAGEAFDKVARVLGLGYPGGPEVEKIAKGAVADLEFAKIKGLNDTYDFSFSGLKTAVINYLNRERQQGKEIDQARVAASFQRLAIEQLVGKLKKAVVDYGVATVLLSGGVAANSYLREKCLQLTNDLGITLYYPPVKLCTDNAAMIGSAGYFKYLSTGGDALCLTANPNLHL